MNRFVESLAGSIDRAEKEAETVYMHLHRHPELSMQEVETSALVAARLKELGADVTEHVGGTGVVGILKNGDGSTVMLRSDMDALPLKEETDVPYVSRRRMVNRKGEEVPVAHACGHDMHMAWLLGATAVLSENRSLWKGTVMAVFQPAEETGEGAQAMLDDDMTRRFPKPDIILGQHVMSYRSGTVAYKEGQILTAGDSLKVTFYGKGGHGGMPQNAVDPIVMAAFAVIRLQAIVAREVSPQAQTVITVGEFHAGTAENIIPDEAYIKLNIRTADEQVRERVLQSVRDVCMAEAQASHAPREPLLENISNAPLTYNDADATKRIAHAFSEQFGDNAFEAMQAGASEDFSRFGRVWGVPYVFWFVGGTEGKKYDEAAQNGMIDGLPGPHSPFWAPALHPTLRIGIETMLAATGVWLAKSQDTSI